MFSNVRSARNPNRPRLTPSSGIWLSSERSTRPQDGSVAADDDGQVGRVRDRALDRHRSRPRRRQFPDNRPAASPTRPVPTAHAATDREPIAEVGAGQTSGCVGQDLCRRHYTPHPLVPKQSVGNAERTTKGGTDISVCAGRRCRFPIPKVATEIEPGGANRTAQQNRNQSRTVVVQAFCLPPATDVALREGLQAGGVKLITAGRRFFSPGD